MYIHKPCWAKVDGSSLKEAKIAQPLHHLCVFIDRRCVAI